MDRGDYPGGYRYIAEQIRNDSRYNPKLAGWFEAAAEINGDPDSFLRDYVFTSNAFAADLNPGDPAVLAENQRVSDILARDVLRDYIEAEREGLVLTPQDIYEADVSSAVEEFGQRIGAPNRIKPHEWAGGWPGAVLYDFSVAADYQPNVYENIVNWDINALKTLAYLSRDFAEDVLEELQKLSDFFSEQFWNSLPNAFSRYPSLWLPAIFGTYFFNRDPLVLDLNTGDVSLTSLFNSATFFDLDSNGFAERTGWVRPGEGLLALDVNGNGRIDNGAELFGTPTTDGFTILRQYDSNGDNRITSDDAIWNSLLIWRDGNGDGISTPDELTSINDNDIRSISLNDRAPIGAEANRLGNSILGISSFVTQDGRTAEVVAVGFRTDQTNTRFIIPDDFEYDTYVFSLPNLSSANDNQFFGNKGLAVCSDF
ncbi:hypothetical protein ACFOWX_08315 [Sphingorhabdus arenilitoris]|uniref:Calcium-binding protein n=1 Tax=Sphingorhabdus arenilitoris TaxID=1490041 RepID=A0ABV8RGQ5_9SPHN